MEKAQKLDHVTKGPQEPACTTTLEEEEEEPLEVQPTYTLIGATADGPVSGFPVMFTTGPGDWNVARLLSPDSVVRNGLFTMVRVPGPHWSAANDAMLVNAVFCTVSDVNTFLSPVRPGRAVRRLTAGLTGATDVLAEQLLHSLMKTWFACCRVERKVGAMLTGIGAGVCVTRTFNTPTVLMVPRPRLVSHVWIVGGT